MRPPRSPALYARFALHLAREFRLPLGVFSALVLLGGLALRLTYHARPLGYAEACYCVFLLIFLEPYLDFPGEW
jgi:voltage-gated potassium channel